MRQLNATHSAAAAPVRRPSRFVSRLRKSMAACAASKSSRDPGVLPPSPCFISTAGRLPAHAVSLCGRRTELGGADGQSPHKTLEGRPLGWVNETSARSAELPARVPKSIGGLCVACVRPPCNVRSSPVGEVPAVFIVCVAKLISAMRRYACTAFFAHFLSSPEGACLWGTGWQHAVKSEVWAQSAPTAFQTHPVKRSWSGFWMQD